MIKLEFISNQRKHHRQAIHRGCQKRWNLARQCGKHPAVSKEKDMPAFQSLSFSAWSILQLLFQSHSGRFRLICQQLPPACLSYITNEACCQVTGPPGNSAFLPARSNTQCTILQINTLSPC